ncbi:MAG TPA: adenylate/guanylate cyclase domain-containing protein [Candidatus Binatia bacterium]|jgi:adenylate cyclase|nr:adenylate/guanylate cyclase domain-containing protein [Candidatus Binatia bacterium]
MDNAQFAELAAWITEAGLAGQTETATLEGFCERALAFDLPLARATVLIDTLHPIYEGRVFTWEREKKETTLTEYGRSDEAEHSERWLRSPFYCLAESGEPLLRRWLTTETENEFPILSDLRAAGMTEYVALANRFAAEGIIGDMDCVYSSWATDASRGFRDADVSDLCRLMPLLALTVKSASLSRIAETLVQTYLGRDAGRRVLEGRIARGIADRIEAVLWFSDLRSYTRITDTAAPGQIIPLLNDYADAIISAIHEQEGDVLKLMGDGVLAIFPAKDRGLACHAALAAAAAARRAVSMVNGRRTAEGLPTTDMYLGLHVGEVFYGNIGSKERLDFTVVGPAVNEVSRIAAMCRSVDQPLLVSSAFASAIGEPKSRLVSVGRFALRGVGRPQDLFTLDPDAPDDHI